MLTFDEYCQLAASYTEYVQKHTAPKAEPPKAEPPKAEPPKAEPPKMEPSPAYEELTKQMDALAKQMAALTVPNPNQSVTQPLTVEDVISKIIGKEE